MARISLSVLGGFVVRADGRPRTLPARKAQALLAYLAMRAGRAHARDGLTSLLWGGARDKLARQSLRQTIFCLRRALGAGRHPALVAQADTVTLNPGAVDVDVARFEHLVRRGTADALEAAAALYHGPLLDGLSVSEPEFDEWLQAERARLHELAVEVLRKIVDRHVKAGRTDAATHAAARLVALDPLQEDMHRTLMRLYARQGRRAAALRQYQTCVAIQQKELGVEPEAETKRLYLEILQRAAPARRATSAAPRPALAPADAPLVGREAELARVRQALHAASRGRGHVVLVQGELGIGKSRLVHELAAVAVASGARVLVGRAYETEQILPFRPWMDAFRTGRALAHIAADRSSSRIARPELARLFPELAGGETPPPITADSHLRLFESIDAVIGELADSAPLLIVLEDLHWADEMTLRLVAFVGRRLGERAVLLVVTVREGDETAPLKRMISELTALPHAEHVTLAALSKPATAALVRALTRTGHAATRLTDLVGKVWTLSEGSPFVIVETMRALREGLPQPADVELPRRVRDMIIARVDRLSPRAQELARVAAVFPRDFEFPVLQRAGGLAPRDTAEAIEELVRRRIFDAVGERFDFTHVRIRQVVYQSLIGPHRQAIHAAVGEAVESVYVGRLDEVYDRLAYHFARADEPSRALTYCVHLADKVARGYALDEAVGILREALAGADRLPVAERDRRRLDVVYRLAHMLLLLGRSDEARDLLLAQATTVTGMHEPSLSGAFHFWLAYALGNLGDGEAFTHAKRALEEAARCGDEVVMGRASFALARETYMMGRALEGIAHARQAVALLERHHDNWWLGQALYMLALNLLHLGDFDSVLEAVERGRAFAEAWGDRRLQAHVAGMAARVRTVMGDVETAIAAGRRAVELAVDPVTRLTAVSWLGAACQEGGDTGRAIELLEDALRELRALSSGGGYRYRQIDPFLRATLAEAYLDHGDRARAHDVAAAALPVATAGGWAVAIGYAARAIARCALAAGKLEDAETAARQALRTFADSDARAQVARSRLTLAEILATRGDGAAATTELTAAREAFVQMRVPRLVDRTEKLAQALGLSVG